MRRPSRLMLPAILLFSCARLPEISPSRETHSLEPMAACQAFCREGDWQLVHAVEAEVSGERTTFLGVTQISSRNRTLRSMIMTVEGLVLFDASIDGDIIVHRALAPFEHEALTKGLIDDVRLLFLAPQGLPVEIGFLEDGSAVCRRRAGDRTVDGLLHPDGRRELRRYGPGAILERIVVEAESNPAGPTPRRLELTAEPPHPYRLVLELIESAAIPASPSPPRNALP